MKSIKILFFCISFLLLATTMNAQQTVRLWDGNPPTSNEITEPEGMIGDSFGINNVSEAQILIYEASKTNNTGMAVVICPGGGYSGLAFRHEGMDVAQWLVKQGITAVLLKYRMPNKHKEVPLDDAQQAIRYVREHANTLGVSVNKVGILGFSAGGHLASTASTHYATSGTNTRPDFAILFYPVITMEAATHVGSKNNLLGDNPTLSDIHLYSNEKQVNANTPPTILFLSDDDTGVLPVNSTQYYEALKRNNVPATMYIFPEGGHGWGMNKDFKYHNQMLTLLEMWLKDIQKKLK
ncbi:alpha/beta hydrolase [Prevotella sp. 10(H)]|uniref:alpha/beta hydrolase n=1 Tax=Prevotella sp. 10(H) TaxID=1158294 RepID=UPI0004A71E65|nr:alpha/beta hydrolase [Prevotella sp. 10(H)]